MKAMQDGVRDGVSLLDEVLFLDTYRPLSLRLATVNLAWGLLWLLADPATIATLTGQAMTPDSSPAWLGGVLFVLLGISHLWFLARANYVRLLNVFISLFFWVELAIRTGLIPLITGAVVVPISLLMFFQALDSAWVFWRMASDLGRLSRASLPQEKDSRTPHE
jgi:hypothetical protein